MLSQTLTLRQSQDLITNKITSHRDIISTMTNLVKTAYFSELSKGWELLHHFLLFARHQTPHSPKWACLHEDEAVYMCGLFQLSKLWAPGGKRWTVPQRSLGKVSASCTTLSVHLYCKSWKRVLPLLARPKLVAENNFIFMAFLCNALNGQCLIFLQLPTAN